MQPPPLPKRASATKVAVITAIITFCVTSFFWVCGGALAYHLMTREPPGFDVQVAHPGTVNLGETFYLTVMVENSSSKKLTLGSIDIYDDLLDGFRVISVSPKPNSMDGLFGMKSYYFRESLSSRESFTFQLELEAVNTGTWSGDIDCCTPTENFVTHFAVVEVIDPPI